MDDPAQLGITFAKELATQLITLSTGVLALSATFTKDILKTIPAGKERVLHAAWGVHILAIIFGVWSLPGITGTLLPLDGVRPNPLQLGVLVQSEMENWRSPLTSIPPSSSGQLAANAPCPPAEQLRG